ncbi:MAG: hypothetical protein K0R68_566 [Mycobacterium sp.]|nr:hypothetical protein [Mycobacterium sp.]
MLLPDPVPPQATVPGQWWPPRFLDPGYLAGHLGGVDIVHVHFGFDSSPPHVLEEVVVLLAERAIPLVVTVHDLDNPHFPDSTEHRARLGVLLAAAAAVITLTPGAAAEVQRLWGRRCTVVPHPHVLAPASIGAPRPLRSAPVVAIHAKALRANIDPWPVLDALVQAGQWNLRLDLDIEAFRSPRAAEVSASRLDAYSVAGVDVRIHPRFSDQQLCEYLSQIDVLVLPYRFGTHSGWVEAAHDAGVCAVVPDCGHFGEQQQSPTYRLITTGPEPDSLHAAVRAALARRPAADLAAQRQGQRERIRAHMTEIYGRVLGMEESCPPTQSRTAGSTPR